MTPSGSPSAEAQQRYYDGMVAARHKLVMPLVIFTLIFFFLQQILTNFTSVLDGAPFPGMTWAYLYSFAQFVVVIILTTYYRRKLDATEAALRPGEIEPVAAHYEDHQTWDEHEDELETEAEMLERLEHEGSDDAGKGPGA